MDVWFRVRERVAADVGAALADLWLEGARLVEATPETATIEVAGMLARDLVAKKLGPALAAAFAAELGGAPAVRVVVEGREPEEPGRPEADMTFATMVVGASNRLAFQAASRVAAAPGADPFNPLVIFGARGLGKTHILRAIARRLWTGRGSGGPTVFATAETFTNEYVAWVHKENRPDLFRSRYRGARALIVDDLDGLRGRLKTQLELIHTIDALLGAGRQVVFGCAPHPKGLEAFHDGLKARLLSAFIVEVRQPDYETRLRIVEARTAGLARRLPREVVDHVARSVTASVRELLDAVARLDARAREGTRVDLALARTALRDLVAPERAPLSPETIVTATCEALGVDPADLARGARGAAVTWARQVAMVLVRELLGATHEAIARHFQRGPSTVSHSVARVESRLAADPALAREVNLLRDRLGGPLIERGPVI